jgi:hypothetical protein
MINLEGEFAYSVALFQVPKDGNGIGAAVDQIMRFQSVSSGEWNYPLIDPVLIGHIS